MARKKKNDTLAGSMSPMDNSYYYPASEAARMALDSNETVSDLRCGLTKAISGTIKRYLSHKPLTRKRKR